MLAVSDPVRDSCLVMLICLERYSRPRLREMHEASRVDQNPRLHLAKITTCNRLKSSDGFFRTYERDSGGNPIERLLAATSSRYSFPGSYTKDEGDYGRFLRSGCGDSYLAQRFESVGVQTVARSSSRGRRRIVSGGVE